MVFPCLFSVKPKQGERKMFSTKTRILFIMLLVSSINIFSQDAEEKKLGWFFEGKLAGLWAGGNSESFTLGLGATLKHIWTNSELRFDAGGLQTESSTTTRTAVGTSENFQVNEDKKTEKTAELIFVRGRYDYNFTENFYALGGIDWLRNRFAGIDSRTLIAAGVGNKWVDNDNVRFKTDYSFTYSFQQDVVENPITKTNFPGVRFAYDFWYSLTASTQFESIFTADWNLDNTKDVRIDFTNSLPIKISEVFTLQPSLQLLWRNEPSLTEIDLFDTDGTPSGSTVLTPLKNLDSLFSLTLVVNL
jgi:putative salt-induced outer membrane protein YdiY